MKMILISNLFDKNFLHQYFKFEMSAFSLIMSINQTILMFYFMIRAFENNTSLLPLFNIIHINMRSKNLDSIDLIFTAMKNFQLFDRIFLFLSLNDLLAM